MQLTASIQELTNNPMYVVNNLQYDYVAIMADDKAMFYCVSEKDFLEFLAFKEKFNLSAKTAETQRPKKPITAFAGILKDKTQVRLTIDEINEAIGKAGAESGMQGIDNE